jgi:hypothetical protein
MAYVPVLSECPDYGIGICLEEILRKIKDSDSKVGSVTVYTWYCEGLAVAQVLRLMSGSLEVLLGQTGGMSALSSS